MSVPICEHIKPSGSRCGSPALAGKTKCFYHANLDYRLPYRRIMFSDQKKNPAPGEWPDIDFHVPDLEDPAAIQIGFMQALHGVCNGNLKPREAKLVLSALHGARMNLKQLETCLSAFAKGALAGKTRKPPAAVKRVSTRASKQAQSQG